MPRTPSQIDRLAAISDGLFSVIITIMVLELKPPKDSTFASLLALWPTVVSYLVSYIFIAIVWLNHHHLLRFTERPTAKLMWINFAHLFMVSLVPVTTAWVAETRMGPVPVFAYAAVFLLVQLAYLQFEHHVLSHAAAEKLPHQTRRLARVRTLLAFALFLASMLASLRSPRWAFAMVCCTVLLYSKPQPPGSAADASEA